MQGKMRELEMELIEERRLREWKKEERERGDRRRERGER